LWWVTAIPQERLIMDSDLRRHLTEMLAMLRPLVEMAERDGVPGQAAARLRAAAFEIEGTLDPGAAAQRNTHDLEQGQENMENIRRREREGAA
jgi:hypothetical protein